MKKSITSFFRIAVLLFCLLTISRSASAQSFLWAKGIGGNDFETEPSIAKDSKGNIYMIGTFMSASLTLDTIILIGHPPNGDIFIVKYNSNGKVIWAKSLGGDKHDTGGSISTDIYGNVYISGSFSSSSITIGNVNFTNKGNSDLFIAKYDAEGNFLWAKSAGGTYSERTASIKTDAQGNVYISGDFGSNNLVLDSITLTNPGGNNGFIAKFNTKGDVIWAQSIGGDNDDYARKIAIDTIGNVYLTGGFSSTSIVFNTITLTNASTTGSEDFFIAKYTNNGSIIWAKRFGGTDHDYLRGLTVDAAQAIYLAGSFYSPTITFGTTTLTNTYPTKGDIFVVKYDLNGNVIWAKSGGGTAHDFGGDIELNANKNLYLTGEFHSTSLLIDGTELTNAANNGGSDILLAKFDADGKLLWAKNFGNTNTDAGADIEIDVKNDVYLTGTYCAPFNFNNIALNYAGGFDIFFTKISNISANVPESDKNLFPISLAPNPSNGEFTIFGLSVTTIGTISIFNILGEKVYAELFYGNQKKINCALKTGMYFVTVTSEEKKWTKKIIIQ